MEQKEENDTLKLKEWETDFKALSGGEDKFITKKDLEKYWQRNNKNPSKEDVDAVCKSLDSLHKDGENKIGLKEFISIQREAEKAKFFTEDSQSELIAALKCFDLRGDNTLSKNDLKGILSDYDDDIIDDLLKAVCAPDDERLPITGLATLLTPTAN